MFSGVLIIIMRHVLNNWSAQFTIWSVQHNNRSPQHSNWCLSLLNWNTQRNNQSLYLVTGALHLFSGALKITNGAIYLLTGVLNIIIGVLHLITWAHHSFSGALNIPTAALHLIRILRHSGVPNGVLHNLIWIYEFPNLQLVFLAVNDKERCSWWGQLDGGTPKFTEYL